MAFVFILLLIVPPGLSAAIFLKCKFEESISQLLLGIIVFGYISALFGLLWLMPYVMYALFLASCLHLLYLVFIRRQVRIASLLSFGLAAFFVLSAALWWLCRGRMLVSWDDFSHWGLAIKDLFYSNTLYTSANSAVIFKDYPPAAPIFQYVMLKAVFASFREDLALFANGLLALSLLVYPLGRFGWKKAGLGSFCALLLFALPPAVNTQMYFRLLVDGLLGVLAAYILLTCFLCQDRSVKNLLPPVLGCFVLSLVKPAGAGLALMAALAVLGDRLLFSEAGQGLRDKKSGFRQVFMFASGPLAAAVLGWLSWAVYKFAMGIVPSKQGTPILYGIWEMLRGKAPAYRARVLSGFFVTMFTDGGSGSVIKFPPAVWFLVFAVIFMVVYRKTCAQRRRRSLYYFIAIAVCNLLYVSGLLLGYLFVFDSGEALQLASVFRYISTAITADFVFYAAALMTLLNTAGLRVKVIGALASALGFFVLCGDSFIFVQSFVTAPLLAAQTQHERFLTSQAAGRIQSLGEEQPRVYIISLLDDNLAWTRILYELLPLKLQNPNFKTSIAASSYYPQEEMSNTAIITLDTFTRMLYKDFDYVYLYNIDGYFTTYYRELFENEDDIVNDTMLRVARCADGAVILRKV